MMTGLPILDGSSAGALASSIQFESICVIDADAERRRHAFTILSAMANRVVRCFNCVSDFAESLSEIDSGIIFVGGSDIMPIVLDIQAVLKSEPRYAIIVFACEHRFSCVVSALRAGVADVLPWPVAEDQLEASISRVRPTISQAEKNWQIRQNASEKLGKLSRRETELLRLLSEGAANKDVANKLGISVRTVEVHRARLMNRIGASSLADIVKLAMADRLYGRF